VGNNLEIYDKALVDEFKHIPEISCYNRNYYIGLRRLSFKNDLLFAWSDDDNTTEWHLVTDKGHQPIGYSYTSDKEEYIRFYPHEMT